MAEAKNRPFDELIEDDDLITAAIRDGVREELLFMARQGISVPESRDGKVIWLTPEQIYERLGVASPAQNKAS